MDQSLNSTGIAYRTAEGVRTTTLKPGKLRGIQRLSYIRNELRKILSSLQPTLVVFEDYVMGFRSATGRLAHLGEVGGILKLAVWEQGIDFMVVPSATLKSVIGTGKRAPQGKSKKPVQDALRDRYGYTVTQEDEADALALMLIGERRCGSPEVAVNATRMAAIEKCEVVAGQFKLKN